MSSKSVVCRLKKPYRDDRGTIQMLVDFPVGSVLVITSRKGAIRANHWHQKDDHYCYLASGRMEYYHRPVGSRARPRKQIIKAGELFYTPPRIEHAMKFVAPSVFYVFAKLRRKPEQYEADIIRVKLV